jgi:hypothetical protein
MAIRLELDNGDLRGRVDYTRYLAAPSQSPMVLRDRLNLPALLDFVLLPADEEFVPPRRSAYVRLTGLADALPPGGPRVPGALFTGYVTSEPVMEYIGVRNGAPLYGYRVEATSEEYLLNVKRIGVVPPFLNQTAGQILRALTDRLQPGRFHTAAVRDGAFIPFFLPDPEESWSEIARQLAERSGFFYRILDGALYFDRIGSFDSGVSMNERDRHFSPAALQVAPVGNPVRNDVTVFGTAEPQARVTEYFVGDGFTSRFPLSFPVFGAESALLLADDFTGSSLDSSKWLVTDPTSAISLFEGRLNVTGGTGTLGKTWLRAQQVLELGGELELIHGEFEFVAPSAGILGGLYAAGTMAASDCLVGFDVSPVGATSRLRAIIQGAVQPLEVVVAAGHHYILVTRLSADQPRRVQQSYPSLFSVHGGAQIPANVRVTLEVRDLDLAAPATPQTVVLYSATLAALPAFAYYACVNSADLHLAANFLEVTRPIQARLEITPPGGSPEIRPLGFGIAEHDATITADPNRNQWALEFYEDTIPARGALVALRYRAAGRAAARLRDAASVAAEAALAGDDGVRAAVLKDLSPSPRSSEEAELAARAFLEDHVALQYEGRFTVASDFTSSFPRTGCLLDVRAESRYPAFTALVRGITTEFRELVSERLEHIIEFGQPSRFEALLRHFAPPEKVLEPSEAISLEPADVAVAGQQFLSDVSAVSLVSVQPAVCEVDMGAQPPPGMVYQVRRSDSGWSTPGAGATQQNLIGSFSTQTFFLPRAPRALTCFIRLVADDGRTSRHSAALVFHLPRIPAQPQSLTVEHFRDDRNLPLIRARVQLVASAIADVDRVELRDEDNSTVLASWSFGQLALEDGAYRGTYDFDNSVALLRSKTMFVYAQNCFGEYSLGRSATASKPVPNKPYLTPGNSVGQILEILLDSAGPDIVETEVQVAGPGTTFANPTQSVVIPGRPEKFTYIAPRAGGYAFRARRRDFLGWSPWSDESQGQLGSQNLFYVVQFFQARELDPSIGAAINAQNLLPNSEFFLGGIPGQEGAHAPRYFSLRNAAPDGSEVDHLLASNEVVWKSGVNFSSDDPGFGTRLTNLGRLFNPGEPVTCSVALRHDGSGTLPHPVRIAMRSASVPSYDRSVQLPASTVSDTYRWFTATFTLDPAVPVPADLSFEICLVIPAGQSIASRLLCDKVILNRGHRPAAFALSPWDVLPLAWNSAEAAYELPATAVASTPRSSDAGSAGLLAGTGTEDLDPSFSGRFARFTT